MAADYRIIVRHFEVECMFAPGTGTYRYFGERYANRLLERIFGTDATQLNALFATFPVPHQTLYAINAFIGEVTNGGICQFLYNAPSVLRDAVPLALGRIGDTEVLDRTRPLLEALRRDFAPTGTRPQPASWGGYLQFKEALGDAAHCFDEWFLAGREGELDERMRAYLAQCGDEMLVVCDGSPRLSRRWLRQTLSRLIREFRQYVETDQSGNPFSYDLLFSSAVREQLGSTVAERRTRAKRVAQHCIPALGLAWWFPNRVVFEAGSTPSIHIRGANWHRIPSVTLQHFADACTMLWRITSWNGDEEAV